MQFFINTKKKWAVQCIKTMKIAMKFDPLAASLTNKRNNRYFDVVHSG